METPGCWTRVGKSLHRQDTHFGLFVTSEFLRLVIICFRRQKLDEHTILASLQPLMLSQGYIRVRWGTAISCRGEGKVFPFFWDHLTTTASFVLLSSFMHMYVSSLLTRTQKAQSMIDRESFTSSFLVLTDAIHLDFECHPLCMARLTCNQNHRCHRHRIRWRPMLLKFELRKKWRGAADGSYLQWVSESFVKRASGNLFGSKGNLFVQMPFLECL